MDASLLTACRTTAVAESPTAPVTLSLAPLLPPNLSGAIAFLLVQLRHAYSGQEWLEQAQRSCKEVLVGEYFRYADQLRSAHSGPIRTGQQSGGA